MGVKHDVRVHMTRRKQTVLSPFPNMCAHHQGCDALVAYNEDLSYTLEKACQ